MAAASQSRVTVHEPPGGSVQYLNCGVVQPVAAAVKAIPVPLACGLAGLAPTLAPVHADGAAAVVSTYAASVYVSYGVVVDPVARTQTWNQYVPAARPVVFQLNADAPQSRTKVGG